MADCSIGFLDFNKKISLSKTERNYLRSARKAVTSKIRTYFSNNSLCSKVDFIAQGSFTMDTIVKPLSGDYDIDIGVYLRGYSNYRRDWPNPETVSQWLINALQNHTSIAPINKRTCVRIQYKPKDPKREISYHVDLPVYIEYVNFWEIKKTRIGLISVKWEQKSDPVGFTRWFNKKCATNVEDKNQLVRIVKYLKAWKDFNATSSKFPSGMVLTVLLADNYSPNDRDDVAFYKTIRSAYNSIDGFFGMLRIKKPVEPFNDLTGRMSSKQKEVFMRFFKQLVRDAKLALREDDHEKSHAIWSRHFGQRF